MGLNSKFYTVNFEKEIVVQGRNTTFLSIEADQTQFAPNENMYAIVYIQPQTFTSKFEAWNFAPSGPLPSPPAGSIRYYFRNADIAKTGVFGVKGFESISIGDDVKAITMNKRALPGQPVNTGAVNAVKFQTTITAKGTTVLGPDTVYFIQVAAATSSSNAGQQYLIQVGNWESDDNWHINQGKASTHSKTMLSPLPPQIVNYGATANPNQFDGQVSTPGGWPAGGANRERVISGILDPMTRFIAPLSPSPTENSPRITYRIDYDAVKDSHIKIQFLVIKSSQVPISFYTAASTQTEWNKAVTNYGQKLADASIPPAGPAHLVDYEEVHIFGYKETDIKTDKTTYQNYYPISDTAIYDDRSSYGLLKTNPSLSGNVKLTVDSGGALWLNSIDANQELSDSRFKKYAISSASTYQRDLHYFFDKGKFPKDKIFSVYQADPQYLNTKRSLSEQYDNFYNYGVEQLNSRFYDEDLSFFAPMWLRKEVPEFFVIFRLDHPISEASYADATNSDKFNEFFKDARIIKTFDMRGSSPLGSYLRKIVDDPRWNERPLQVSFDEDTQSTWFGIDYNSGTITGKGEFLYDFFSTDHRILDFEETVTGGFERNGLISSNLINMEFLFNDSEAKQYTINRYFGFYVNETQLAEFELSSEILGAMPLQTPAPKPGRDGEVYSLQPFVQSNPNGIRLPIDYYHNPPVGPLNTTATPLFKGLVDGKFPLPSMVDDPLRFFYVKDRNGVFKRVNKLEENNYGAIGSPAFKRVTELQLFDSTENISDFSGISQIVSQIKTDLLGNVNAQSVIKISDVLQSGIPIANYETIEIALKKLNTERREYYYSLVITAIAGPVITFNVLVPDYSGLTPTVPNVYYATKSANFATLGSVDVDSYLKFDWAAIGIAGAVVGNTWTVTVKDGNITSAIASNITARQLTFYGQPNYLSFRWRMEANPIGLSPGETWDYPVIDPAGRDYKNAFCNNGTPEQVAQALTNCINSFENIIVTAKAEGDTIYLRSKEKWEDGNSISVVRNYMVNQSVPKNVGFYENCNIKAWEGTSTLMGVVPPTVITISPNNYSDVYTERFFYLNAVNTFPGTWTIEVRADVDPTSMATAAVSGSSSTWMNANPDPAALFAILDNPIGVPEFTASWPMLAPSFTAIYLLKHWRSQDEQYLITGRRRNRATAKVPIIDGKRFYADRKTTTNGSTTIGSFTISSIAFPNSIYQGAIISGPGIPVGSRVLQLNSVAGTITISKSALVTATNVSLNVGELSILNDIPIYQQWFQIQKENYSRLKGWDVQGKLVYAPPFINSKIENYKEHSIIQVEKDESEFYYTQDSTILAFDVFRPTFGVLSAMPIKTFDVDSYFSDYSYAPTLEMFRYFNRQELEGEYVPLAPPAVPPAYGSINGELTMNMGENYDLTIDFTDAAAPSPSEIGVIFDIEVYDTNDKTWKKVDEIGTTLSLDPASLLPLGSTEEQLASVKTISINTYYPMYFYDFMEVPNDYRETPLTTPATTPGPYNSANTQTLPLFPSLLNTNDQSNHGPQYTAIGTRNFVRKKLFTDSSTPARFSKARITNIRIGASPITAILTPYSTNFFYKFRLQSSNYYKDENIKTFAGFQSLTDFLTESDLQQIQKYTDDGSFEKFTYQMLLSEYDRLRENQQKDIAVKSKVVPSILKWVQEGTDARDNYYRLNNSTAFGITNFSPDSEVDFTEPLLLTHEFPYMDAVPKDYPEESLEGSRSYFFQKLSDIAYNGRSWYDLLTKDDTNDWFTKYFVVGYPNEISPEKLLVPKSRDERYTFFKYTEGVDLSQTLFRGAKISILDYDTTVSPKSLLNESKRFDLYKFAAISRFVTHHNFQEEKPIQIEVINNEKFKTILIIITIFVQDYRLQAGLGDYAFLYYAQDQLRNSMQNQYPGGFGAYSKFFDNSPFLVTIGPQGPDYKYPMEIPYTAYTPITGYYRDLTNYFPSTIAPWSFISEDVQKALQTMMPRQLFLGGGRLELDDTKLGGKAWHVSTAPGPGIKTIFQPLINPDYTDPYPASAGSSLDYYPVFKEVFPTINNYRSSIDSYLKGTTWPYVFASAPAPGQTKPTDSMSIDGTLSEFSVSSVFAFPTLIPNPTTFYMYNTRNIVDDIRLNYIVFDSTQKYSFFRSNYTGAMLKRSTKASYFNYSAATPPVTYPPYSLSGIQENMVQPNISQFVVNQTHNLRGGSQYYKNKKNFISYANIIKLFNENSNYILYKTIKVGSLPTISCPTCPASIPWTAATGFAYSKSETDFELRFVQFDKIKKMTKNFYEDDTDKPLEYQDSNFIGYNLIKTQEQEYEFRHRGLHEPKTLDVINFWARENDEFTRHFEKDFVLCNTHINSYSVNAGQLRNYFYNKVADSEVLQISRSSAYKSLYPLISEISIDLRDVNALDSSWDSNFYRKYSSTKNYVTLPGTSEMKETKVFLGGKAMIVPKTFDFQVFSSSEITFKVVNPQKSIGSSTLPQINSVQDSLLESNKLLIVTVDLQQKLLAALLDGMLQSTNFDEFAWFNGLGISAITYSQAELDVLKKEYLEKNILPLYEVESIVFYSNNNEGLPIFQIDLSYSDKIAAGFKVDKNITTFNKGNKKFVLHKIIDSKAANAYTISAVLKRV